MNLVDDEGNIQKAVPLAEALNQALENDLDLVQLNMGKDDNDADIPVCKIMNYSKYRYQKQKKQSVQVKKNIIKEIQLRLNIETNDYNVKLRAIEKFLKSNFKVVIVVKLFGREFLHKDLGLNLLHKVADDLKDLSKIEKEPAFYGRKLLMTLRKS